MNASTYIHNTTHRIQNEFKKKIKKGVIRAGSIILQNFHPLSILLSTYDTQYTKEFQLLSRINPSGLESLIFSLSPIYLSLSLPPDKNNMDSRNYINPDYYVRMLREKAKRETKVTKMQNKILGEQQKQQLKPLCPKKPKKLSDKWLRQNEKKPNENKGRAERKFHSNSENDLLNEIDNSLKGEAKGFVFKMGN